MLYRTLNRAPIHARTSITSCPPCVGSAVKLQYLIGVGAEKCATLRVQRTHSQSPILMCMSKLTGELFDSYWLFCFVNKICNQPQPSILNTQIHRDDHDTSISMDNTFWPVYRQRVCTELAAYTHNVAYFISLRGALWSHFRVTCRVPWMRGTKPKHKLTCSLANFRVNAYITSYISRYIALILH